MSVSTWRYLWVFLGSLAVFFASVSRLPQPGRTPVAQGEVVLPAALQWVIYGGDPYLAANIEATRLMVSGEQDSQENMDFYLRLHRAIVELNPCHEDSLYLAAAFLPSGGAPTAALKILEKNSQCRFWDAWAFFHLGFNYFLFAHDTAKAVEAIRTAEQLSHDPKTATLFQSIGLALKARSFDEAEAAIQYLRTEQKRTRDQGLRQSLERRISRLQGLSSLRNAQRRFEKEYRRDLVDPEELLRTGIIKSFPVDPMGLGFEFINGRFELRDVKVGLRGNP